MFEGGYKVQLVIIFGSYATLIAEIFEKSV